MSHILSYVINYSSMTTISTEWQVLNFKKLVDVEKVKVTAADNCRQQQGEGAKMYWVVA